MIPEGWEKVMVKDIAKVIRGASPRPKGDPRYYGGSVPRLMGADVTRDGKYVTPCIDFLTKEGAKLSRAMPKGTLVIVCSGTVGIPAILNVDCCIHDGFLALYDISKFCNIDYLYEIFSFMQAIFFASATHGGVFINLTTDILREFEFLLPPLPEQRKIAEILNTWDKAIALLEQLITAKRKLKQGLMQQLLTGKKRFKEFEGNKSLDLIPEGWEMTQLKEIVCFLDKQRVPLKKEERSNRQGIYPYYGASGIIDYIDDFIFDDELLLLSEDGANILDRNYPVAFIAIGKFWVNNHAHVLKPLQTNINWLSNYLESLDYSKFNSGTAQPKLNREICEHIPVLLPPLPEQQKIASILSAADAEISNLEKQLAAYKQQKRGLMQQLLTGKKRVKIDEPQMQKV